jgi:hypothetical protein
VVFSDRTFFIQPHQIALLPLLFQLKTLTGKVITTSGVKPTVEVKWQRENFWIYDAIEPLTGKHFQHEYPKLNDEYFQQFLDWLSQQLGSHYAILQIDQASAHTSGSNSLAGEYYSSASTTPFSRTQPYREALAAPQKTT